MSAIGQALNNWLQRQGASVMRQNVVICDPRQYSSDINTLLDNLVKKGEIKPSEKQEKMGCLIGYLTDYAKFASAEPRPTNEQVEGLMRATMKLIRETIAVGDRRIAKIKEQLKPIEDGLVKEGARFIVDEDGERRVILPDDVSPTLERLRMQWEWPKTTLEFYEERKSFLNNIEKDCIAAKTRLDKALCIESFVSAVHYQGEYLARGCNFSLPEDIKWEKGTMEDVAIEAVKVTEKTLSCLAGEKK